MKQVRLCDQCHGELPGDALEGLCPRCLLRLGGIQIGVAVTRREPPESASGKQGAPRRFGNYELLEQIGQGGMGTVYKARQLNLDRVVALKLLPFGQFSLPDVVQRFRSEASAAAALQHPNIVAVHDVGEQDGQHYFSMDFVEGRTLADVVREKPLPARRAATYLKTISEAVHYAHQHGILHRDLKPSNILIDHSDQPRITDFGLAKRLTVDSDMTLTGQVLGSPNFMAPEQAEGRLQAIGPATEVYALGALLYHLLARQPPFQADTLTTLLKQVIEADPVAPRLLNPSIPRDLETICLKCLEKEPRRRYQTAQALADELGRFLAGEPVTARPVGTAGKTWRWCRRQPVRAGLSAALIVVFVSGLAGVLWQWRKARQNAEAELRQRYAADMRLAQLHLEADDRDVAIRLLDKYRPAPKSGGQGLTSAADLRGWEWRYLWRLCQPDASFSLQRHTNAVDQAAISPDGRWLAIHTQGNRVVVWDVVAKRTVREMPALGWVLSMALSSNGGTLAVSRALGGEPALVELRDLHSGSVMYSFSPTSLVRSLVLSPDDRLLATLSADGTAQVIEWKSGRVLANLTAAPFRRGGTGVVAFSPDGNLLAVGADYGWLRVLDLQSGAEREIETETLDGVSALAFAPDSALLAAGFAYTSGTVGLWNSNSGEPQGQLTNATSFVRALAFTPDGRRLAAASLNGTIRIWEMAERTERRLLKGHPNEELALAFQGDGQTLVSACARETACVWDLNAASPASAHVSLPISFRLTPKLPGEHFVPGQIDPRVVQRLGWVFTPDSRQFITTSPEGTLGVWDLRTMQQSESLPALGTNCWQVALSPDGRWLAVGDAAGKVHVWDWPEGRRIASFEIPFEWCGTLKFSSSGRYLLAKVVANDQNCTRRIWRTRDWKEMPLPGGEVQGLSTFDLSPDDQLLAVGSYSGLRIWKFPSGRLEAVVTTRPVRGTLFSPDGRFLVSTSGTEEKSVTLWETATWSELARVHGHVGAAWSVGFSPDGRRFATGGETPRDAIKLWDTATQRELLTLRVDGLYFLTQGFSPDGNVLMATSLLGVAHLWRAPSWEDIAAAERALP